VLIVHKDGIITKERIDSVFEKALDIRLSELEAIDMKKASEEAKK
jgi:hypothetical protein